MRMREEATVHLSKSECFVIDAALQKVTDNRDLELTQEEQKEAIAIRVKICGAFIERDPQFAGIGKIKDIL